MYPLRRNRRLRSSEGLRSLVRETVIHPNDFIVPLFVVEGNGVREEIASMPNYYRLSLDLLSKEAKELWQLGLKSVLLFVKVDDKDYPGYISMNFVSEEQVVNLKINMNGFSTEQLSSLNFEIPEKYKKIRVN